MEVFKTMNNETFGLEDAAESDPRHREAVRAVLMDKNNNVAIIPVDDGGYHNTWRRS